MHVMVNKAGDARVWPLANWLGLLPPAVLLVAVGVFALHNAATVFDPPLLLFVLNTLFLSVIGFVVAALAGRAYVTGGSRVLLFLGCGVLAFGVGSLVAGLVSNVTGGTNVEVTVYNIAALIGATFHALSVIVTTDGDRPGAPRRSTAVVLAAYFLVVCLIVLITIAAQLGVIPRFFIQGVGPSSLRQLVLGGAILLFVVSALSYVQQHVRTGYSFFYWYGVGLGLIAIGLTAVFITRAVGSPLSWVGRFGQYLGGLYFVVAFVTIYGRSRSIRRSLQHVIASLFREAQTDYRALVEAATDAMITFDQTGNILVWNSTAIRMFGYERHEALEASFLDLIVPASDRTRVWQKIERFATPPDRPSYGATRLLTFEAETRTGETLPVELSLTIRGNGKQWTGISVVRDIRERRRVQAERERLVSELQAAHAQAEAERQHLYDLFMNAPAFMCVLHGPDHVFTMANPLYYQIVGRSDLIGRSVRQVFPELEQQGYFEILDTVYETGQPFTGEEMSVTIVPEDGEPARELFINFVYQPIVESDGSVSGIFVHGIDVSEQVRSREQIEEIAAERERSLAELEALISSMTDGLVVADPDGYITTMNPAARAMIGISDDTEMHRHISTFARFLELRTLDGELLPLEDWPISRILNGERIRNVEVQQCYVDRDDTWIGSCSGTPVYDADGRLIFALLTIRDVTEQKQIERRLRDSEARFRAFFDNTLDAILVADDTGTYVDANPAACTLLGYEHDDLIGRTLWEVTVGLEAAGVSEQWREFLRTGEQSGEFQVRHKDGRIIDVEFRAVANVLPGFHLSTLRDITARKRAMQALYQSQQQLKTLNAQLEQRVADRTAELQEANRLLKQRNRELQDFAYVASHDLQEPLRKIRTFADLLQTHLGDELTDDNRLYFDRMTNAAERMSTLLRNLLTFSRVATHGNPFEPTDLNEVVRNVLIDLDLLIEDTGAWIEVKDLPTIDTDRGQIRRVFHHLIENAIIYRDSDRPPVIQISAHITEMERGTACRLVVADNGIGFEEEYAERIFDPFQRLHGNSAYDGTGMGLAISRRIVERHGGTITAESDPGAGSRFIVTLPVRQVQHNDS